VTTTTSSASSLQQRPSQATGGRSRPLVIRPASASLVSLRQHLAILPEYADLFLTLSAHRINVRYRQTALGVIWAVLHPLAMMIIFTAVFSVLARMPSDGLPYGLFAYTALLPWTFFATAFTTATNSLVAHGQLITKVFFPREILPATYIVAALFDFAIGFVVLLLLMGWYGVALTSQALNIVPIVLVLVAWVSAVSLVMCALQVRWRDVGVAMPLVVQLWMFASPVIYPLSVVPPDWRAWYLLNPMAGIIESFRAVLLHGVPPDPVPLRYAVAITAVGLPFAYLFFKRAEATMADLI
jgi:lipopolysaccharide transport system permease protein